MIVSQARHQVRHRAWGGGGGAEGYTTAGNLSLYRLTLGVPFDVILTHGHGTEDRPPRRPRKVPSEFDTNGK